ncbi:MAG: LamG-like jellyroll fold domain-containing protein [bacterium]
MMNAHDTRLNPLRLRRLRRALAADDQVQSRTRPHARRVALSIFAALFVGIAGLAWHDTNAASLSTSTQFASRTSRFVSPAERAAHAAVEESMKMQRMATIGAAALGAAVLVTSAHAQNSGFARFDQTSDTIRILGNTVFPGTDWTYEARIRLDTAMLGSGVLGYIISEQRDASEDKSFYVEDTNIRKATIRGYNCGDLASGSLDTSMAAAWKHLAWVRSGAVLSLYVEGNLIQSWANRPSCSVDRSDSWMSIGMFRYGAGYSAGPAVPSFLGDLDWIHISAGAGYTTNFTPPYECEVTADASTQLLLKFNEPAGTTTLIDESASHFVCDLGVPVAPGVTASSPTLGNTTDGFAACAPPCPGDIDENSIVDGIDLAIILSRWGTNPKDYPRADTNDDGTVDGADLAQVLGMWGACP